VPKRYVDQVQLSAVLRPAYGRLATEADIIDATAWALYHWRRRATQLASAGWGPLGIVGRKSRLPNAMSCPVAFVMTYDGKAGRRPCKFRQICPFCWAREVRRHWLKIDAAFFPVVTRKRRVRVVDTDSDMAKSKSFTRSVKDVETGVKSPYDLVRRVFTFRVPRSLAYPVGGARIVLEDDVGRMLDKVKVIADECDGRVQTVKQVVIKRSGLLAYLDSRIRGRPDSRFHRLHECRKLLESAGPGGGMLEVVSFRHVDDPAYPCEVQVHQLILAADGTKVPKQMHELSAPESRRHIVISKPGRRVVTAAVARALRYPQGLIDPKVPIEDVIAYLEARRGRRLVASFGCFRNQKT
jgi:hypothetical protein